MTTPNARSIIKLKGRLVANPTDLTLAYPHGGEELGLVARGRFVPNIRHQIVRAEEFGAQVTEVVRSGTGSAVLLALMRGYDDDMVKRVFPSTSVGTSSNTRLVEADAVSGGQGTLLSTSSIVLFFSPEDVDQHPSILMYNALPLVEEAAEMQLDISSELTVAVAFRLVHDATFRNYRIGRREDLSL